MTIRVNSDTSLHKEIVHLFLLYVLLDKLTELFLDMSDDERINSINKIQLVVYYDYQCCVLIVSDQLNFIYYC